MQRPEQTQLHGGGHLGFHGLDHARIHRASPWEVRKWGQGLDSCFIQRGGLVQYVDAGPVRVQLGRKRVLDYLFYE